MCHAFQHDTVPQKIDRTTVEDDARGVDGISPDITSGREAENKKRNTQSSYKSKPANDPGKSQQWANWLSY